MIRSAIMTHLDPNAFEPFALRMNNGDLFVVKHPELAQLLRDDSLYIFEPARDGSVLRDEVTIVRIHNICLIHKPLDQAA